MILECTPSVRKRPLPSLRASHQHIVHHLGDLFFGFFFSHFLIFVHRYLAFDTLSPSSGFVSALVSIFCFGCLDYISQLDSDIESRASSIWHILHWRLRTRHHCREDKDGAGWHGWLTTWMVEMLGRYVGWEAKRCKQA